VLESVVSALPPNVIGASSQDFSRKQTRTVTHCWKPWNFSHPALENPAIEDDKDRRKIPVLFHLGGFMSKPSTTKPAAPSPAGNDDLMGRYLKMVDRCLASTTRQQLKKEEKSGADRHGREELEKGATRPPR
jgi:hypothetical protein